MTFTPPWCAKFPELPTARGSGEVCSSLLGSAAFGCADSLSAVLCFGGAATTGFSLAVGASARFSVATGSPLEVLLLTTSPACYVNLLADFAWRVIHLKHGSIWQSDFHFWLLLWD